MDSRSIRCFQLVYEKGSIHQAAKELFITPQGISRIISALEGELQTPLFVRSHGGMAPTEAGTYFYGHTQSLRRQLMQLQLGIQELKQQPGLRIGFACGVLNLLSPSRFRAWKARHPELVLEWTEDFNADILKMIREGTLSCGFCIGPVPEDGLFHKELYRTTVSALVYDGHPFYGRQEISVEDLKDQPLICLNEHFSIFHALVERCADFGFTPQFAVKTMESSLIEHFCRERLGLGIDVPIHPVGEPLRCIPIRETAPWRISFVCQKGRQREPLLGEMASLLMDGTPAVSCQ